MPQFRGQSWAVHFALTQSGLILWNTAFSWHEWRRLYNAFAESGVTPHAYIQSARLDLAGRLLNQPGPRKASIAEVGRVCGYADAAHFSRSFHAHHGVPPRLWRSAAS